MLEIAIQLYCTPLLHAAAGSPEEPLPWGSRPARTRRPCPRSFGAQRCSCSSPCPSRCAWRGHTTFTTNCAFGCSHLHPHAALSRQPAACRNLSGNTVSAIHGIGDLPPCPRHAHVPNSHTPVNTAHPCPPVALVGGADVGSFQREVHHFIARKQQVIAKGQEEGLC